MSYISAKEAAQKWGISERMVYKYCTQNRIPEQGAFDSMVRSVLKELVSLYPHINYAVVLERMPPKGDEFDTRDYSDTMLPEGVEKVHPRFAISWRNKWMIKQSDYVVTYITHSWGGAAQFAELAEKQKKTVINVTVKVDGVQMPMR